MMIISLSVFWALLALFSKVSAFSKCDASIIMNIENSNLTAFPPPKIVLFSDMHFKYDYATSCDACILQSADIVFGTAQNLGQYIYSQFNLYRDGSTNPTPYYITFSDIGDPYEVNALGFIDSPTSNNQVYIWQVQGIVVGYYCSLDCRCDTGKPLFVLNTLIDNCVITDEQLEACQDTINLVNNNVAVPLTKLAFPPTSVCSELF